MLITDHPQQRPLWFRVVGWWEGERNNVDGRDLGIERRLERIGERDDEACVGVGFSVVVDGEVNAVRDVGGELPGYFVE